VKKPVPTPAHDALVAWTHQALVEGNLAYRLLHDPDAGRPGPREKADRRRDALAAEIPEWETATEAGSLKGIFSRLSHKSRDELLEEQRRHLEWLRKRVEGYDQRIATRPAMRLAVDDVRWEHPVTNERGTVVGSVDLYALVSGEVWRFDSKWLEWRAVPLVSAIYFEIKPAIPSVGELLRQINKYRHYREDGIWVVVTPSDRYAGLLATQDVQLLVPNLSDRAPTRPPLDLATQPRLPLIEP
jgi:hypothetical protein